MAQDVPKSASRRRIFYWMTLPLSQLMRQAKLSQNESHTIYELSEGLSQQCYELKTYNQSYIIKQFDDKINFCVEFFIYHALKDSEISAELITSLSEGNQHCLMLKKLEGISLNAAQINPAAKLVLATELLASFHHQLRDLPRKQPSVISSLPLSDTLFILLEKTHLNSAKHQLVSKAINNSLRRLLAHKPNDSQHICCHGDLNFSNIFQCEGQLKTIDFESASFMPAEYDIAMMLAVNEFDETAIAGACQTYQQATAKFSPKRRYSQILNQELIQAYYLISILINGLWYVSKSSHSTTKTNQKKLLLDKARAQFSLSTVTKELTKMFNPT
jgi:thiamine kinase-like enzyme